MARERSRSVEASRVTPSVADPTGSVSQSAAHHSGSDAPYEAGKTCVSRARLPSSSAGLG
jgi:hypothetical protein